MSTQSACVAMGMMISRISEMAAITKMTFTLKFLLPVFCCTSCEVSSNSRAFSVLYIFYI